MKRTKILCTIGPSSAKESTVKSMMKSGMDAARLNFSHGDHKGHRALYRTIRSAAKSLDRHVKTGSEVVFSTAIDEFKGDLIPVTYKQLHKEVKKGERLLIDDGILEAEVLRVAGKQITAKMINGGLVTSHKGMNFPDSHLKVSSITEKDKEDAAFGVKLGVDWIALSFVTDPADVKLLKRLIKKAGKPGQVLPRVIVKIEKHEAIDRFTEILAVTDGVMIARGDLGIEIPAEEVPVRQKEMIEQCRQAGVPVVVATQMLDSMIRNPRPTRAEVSDVANAVFDHTDAVMLSGESATGKYPVKAVKMMAKIVQEAEDSPFDDIPPVAEGHEDKIAVLSDAIKLVARQNQIDAVVASAELAPWAETVFRTHPEIPFYLAASSDVYARQASLRWSARTFVLKSANENTFMKRAFAALKKKRKLKKGSKVAVIMGKSHGDGYDLVAVE